MAIFNRDIWREYQSIGSIAIAHIYFCCKSEARSVFCRWGKNKAGATTAGSQLLDSDTDHDYPSISPSFPPLTLTNVADAVVVVIVAVAVAVTVAVPVAVANAIITDAVGVGVGVCVAVVYAIAFPLFCCCC